jgi:hypothetical protein
VRAGPEPELVAVPAAGKRRLGRGGGERAAHVGVHGPAVAQPARRNDPARASGPIRDRSPVEQQLPEPGHIPGGGAQAAVVDGGAQPVMEEAGVVPGAHRRPHQLGDQLGHRLAARPLAHPAQHVGFRRAVQETASVRRLGPQRGQEPVQPARLSGRPVLAGPPVDPLIHPPDVGLRVGVLLQEGDPAAHVQHVPHRGAGVAAAGQLGDVVRHQVLGIELAPVDEHRGHAAQHRLRHRHQRMRPVRRSERAVPLGHQLTVLQYRVCVGVGVVQDLARRAG